MKNVVEVSNLSLWRNTKMLFNSVSFTLEAGNFYFFRGINGSGKSTLFELLSGNLKAVYLEKMQGQVRFFDNQYSLENISEIRNQICFIPQQAIFDEYITVKEFLSLPFDFDIARVPKTGKINDYLVKFLETNQLEKALECKDPAKLLKKRISKLSLGQQHIISIYGSLIGREQSCFLYLFDEPLNYLDYNNSVLVLNKINQIHLQNKQAVIVTCSHCQSVQSVDIAYEIKGTCINKIDYKCYSCFGLADGNGFIQEDKL